MTSETAAGRGLSGSEREQFILDGFVRLDEAFTEETAAAARAILWGDLRREFGCEPDQPETWTRPVVRLWDYAQAPFREAANTERLRQALDELVGAGRWKPRTSLGTFPVRFPHEDDPGDAGWHVDASFALAGEEGSFLNWRVNVRSKRRALLMLFLFSDVGERDAPTRIRVGSHRRVARVLEPAGEEGLRFMELAEAAEAATRELPEALATGRAGTVYLCHPFLVHAAQRHGGKGPRMMAQPPLYARAPLELEREDGAYSAVEEAVRLGLRE